MKRNKLIQMIVILVVTIPLLAVLITSCVTETSQVMKTSPEPETPQEEIEQIYNPGKNSGFQHDVRTFIYTTEDGICYRVFLYGNGIDEAGIVVINESLQKEQLRYYSKLH